MNIQDFMSAEELEQNKGALALADTVLTEVKSIFDKHVKDVDEDTREMVVGHVMMSLADPDGTLEEMGEDHERESTRRRLKVAPSKLEMFKLKDVTIFSDASLRKPGIEVVPKSSDRKPYIASSYPNEYDLSDPALYLFMMFVNLTQNGIPASDVYDEFRKIDEFREAEARWNKLELRGPDTRKPYKG